MSVALVPRDGNTLTVSPLMARSRISVSTGRPVSRSICVAQLTLTNGFAAISLPLVRSSTYRKTVFVRADEHFAHLPLDHNICDEALGVGVEVKTVVRHGLVIPNHFARLRPDREGTGGIQTVHAIAIGWVIRLGVPSADIKQVKLRVIRSILPSCSAAILPGFGLGRVRPRFRTGFARRGYGPRAPQSVPGIMIAPPVATRSAPRS